MKLLPEVVSALQALQQEYIWIVISEGWCGDAAQLLPVFDKMAEQSEGKIELRIVLRDENEELMSHFLTNKSQINSQINCYQQNNKWRVGTLGT
jgi:hypothetical protein